MTDEIPLTDINPPPSPTQSTSSSSSSPSQPPAVAAAAAAEAAAAEAGATATARSEIDVSDSLTAPAEATSTSNRPAPFLPPFSVSPPVQGLFRDSNDPPVISSPSQVLLRNLNDPSSVATSEDQRIKLKIIRTQIDDFLSSLENLEKGTGGSNSFIADEKFLKYYKTIKSLPVSKNFHTIGSLDMENSEVDLKQEILQLIREFSSNLEPQLKQLISLSEQGNEFQIQFNEKSLKYLDEISKINNHEFEIELLGLMEKFCHGLEDLKIKTVERTSTTFWQQVKSLFHVKGKSKLLSIFHSFLVILFVFVIVLMILDIIYHKTSTWRGASYAAIAGLHILIAAVAGAAATVVCCKDDLNHIMEKEKRECSCCENYVKLFIYSAVMAALTTGLAYAHQNSLSEFWS